MVPIQLYLVLSVVLFAIGTVGVLLRRNAIVVFMCIELMLNAGNLALVTFGRQFAEPAAHVYVFLVMAIAAAEVSVGLAIIIAVYRSKGTINVDELNEMHG
ncbi:MAG: NADH-quinone oxidoreductase subunit NuoK [Deltaproteobacteria bacterium]|nr:NADH-quinone oxidoreductase subunit NuoK [Deltaproteobacteria bacterium]